MRSDSVWKRIERCYQCYVALMDGSPTRPAEFTATSSISRGQLCVVDLAAGTVSPATTKAARLERELQSIGWNGDRS